MPSNTRRKTIRRIGRRFRYVNPPELSFRIRSDFFSRAYAADDRELIRRRRRVRQVRDAAPEISFRQLVDAARACGDGSECRQAFLGGELNFDYRPRRIIASRR